MLFRVSNSEVYLGGTIHFLPDGVAVSARLLAAMSAADDCVFESDLEQALEPGFAHYPDGDSIHRHIPAELFARMSALCDSLDIPGVLPHYKPWWVGLVIAVHLIIQAGNRPEFGADRQLWNAAKQSGKRPFVLESINVLRAFDSSPISEQIARLELIVSNPLHAVTDFNRLYAAWRVGDTVALARELQTNLDFSPVTFRALVHDRNRQWLPHILGAIERRRSAVFAVGALHLVGEHSLQRLLSDHGHTLLPV